MHRPSRGVRLEAHQRVQGLAGTDHDRKLQRHDLRFASVVWGGMGRPFVPVAPGVTFKVRSHPLAILTEELVIADHVLVDPHAGPGDGTVEAVDEDVRAEVPLHPAGLDPTHVLAAGAAPPLAVHGQRPGTLRPGVGLSSRAASSTRHGYQHNSEGNRATTSRDHSAGLTTSCPKWVPACGIAFVPHARCLPMPDFSVSFVDEVYPVREERLIPTTEVRSTPFLHVWAF